MTETPGGCSRLRPVWASGYQPPPSLASQCGHHAPAGPHSRPGSTHKHQEYMKDFRPRCPEALWLAACTSTCSSSLPPLLNTDLVLASRLFLMGHSDFTTPATVDCLSFVGTARLQPPRCLPAAELERPAVGKPQSWSRLERGRWGLSCTEGARWEAG